jgi:hypothetical protein
MSHTHGYDSQRLLSSEQLKFDRCAQAWEYSCVRNTATSESANKAVISCYDKCALRKGKRSFYMPVQALRVPAG